MKPSLETVRRMPLAAILRGITPPEAPAIGEVLVAAGFLCIEVPLNSPDPYASIEVLAQRFGDRTLIGAGTVRTADEVARVQDRGGRLIVMPHGDVRVVAVAKRLGLTAMPGFATPTEAFAVLDAGADALKLFPAEACPPPVLKAMRAVLPAEVPVFPVGSVRPETMRPYWEAGANGFGLGSALYRAGDTPETVAANAERFVAAMADLLPR
jgi:2-dehydro-3-deoxyphosphogalactonate aldolase